MTTRFLRGLAEHLNPDGEAWLMQSTLAEQLGLRHRDYIPDFIDRADLHVRNLYESAPATANRQHAPNNDDPVAHARHYERLRLWRLSVRSLRGGQLRESRGGSKSENR